MAPLGKVKPELESKASPVASSSAQTKKLPKDSAVAVPSISKRWRHNNNFSTGVALSSQVGVRLAKSIKLLLTRV